MSYYFPKGVGEYHYGVSDRVSRSCARVSVADLRQQERHPMKPQRLSLTNALVMGYGLDKQIHEFYNPRSATQAELEMYHDHDYIDFLSRQA